MDCEKIELEYFKYIDPSIKHKSVKKENSVRVIMARKQLKKYTDLIEAGWNKETILQTTTRLVKEILSKIGMRVPDDFNCVAPVENKKVDYETIVSSVHLENKNDIVWIKLNTNGCISVVGTSRDISFSNRTEKKTSSGKINTHLHQEWDKSKVLIFPLINIPKELNRSDVESIVGNYLTDHDIPILDFFSHRY